MKLGLYDLEDKTGRIYIELLALFGRFLPPSSEGPEEGRKDGEVYGTTR